MGNKNELFSRTEPREAAGTRVNRKYVRVRERAFVPGSRGAKL